MIAILSPAKNLDFNTPVPLTSCSSPTFINEANQLSLLLQKLSVSQLGALLNTNQKLTLLNANRYANWQKEPMADSLRQAIFSYKGEVYNGLNALTLSPSDLLFAQEHLFILSGLYGLLRPLDNIQPYRLEMQAQLIPPHVSNLYEFWSGKITKKLKSIIEKQQDKIIINLASNEYSSVIDFKKLNVRVINPVFKDFHNGQYKFLTIYGKKARGLMARFFLKSRITDPEQLKLFDSNGYYFNERLSKENDWVFTRG